MQRRVHPHVLLPVETGAAEGHLHQVAHRVRHARRDHVVVGALLLEHEPHRADVVAGEAPVAGGVQVAERERVVQPGLDARDAVAHLPRHELETPARRFVVEQDARAGEEAVALAVVDGDVVAEDLRDAVGAARVERRQLVLRHLAYLPEHLARRGLVQADPGVDRPDRVEDPRHPLRVELAGQHRLVPACRDEGHRRQVVQLVRLHPLDHADERQLVEQVCGVQGEPVEQVLDAGDVRGAGAPDDPRHLVPLLEEQLGEIGPVLTGDSGDECSLGHLKPS